MSALDDPHRDVVERLAVAIGDGEPWALTGSASFALQGVPVDPNDVDVQTTAAGAYAIESTFAARLVDPVSFSSDGRRRSHFGAFELDGVCVEIMGDVQKRREDGTWAAPVDVEAHRTTVDLGSRSIPVLSLEYEAAAYERLGREERAAVLRDHVDG